MNYTKETNIIKPKYLIIDSILEKIEGFYLELDLIEQQYFSMHERHLVLEVMLDTCNSLLENLNKLKRSYYWNKDRSNLESIETLIIKSQKLIIEVRKKYNTLEWNE